MRISELSSRTGVPVATIKYYLREGLLSPGHRSAATQAQYDDRHVGRLRLIRALREVGQLRLAAIRRVLAAVDDDRTGMHELLGTACYALSSDVDASDPEFAPVRAEVDAFLASLDWQVSPSAPARDELAQAVLILRRLGVPCSVDNLRSHAEAARSVAVREVDQLAEGEERAKTVERAVVSTVLYEPVLLALRRLAQEHESSRRFGPHR
jgi:DNA-binding transcriptional MerR regulator